MADRNLTTTDNPPGWQPLWAPLSSLRREMDRLFDDYLLPGESRILGSWALQPCIELEESDDAYAVTAEMPGIDQKDITLDLKDNVLTLVGEKRDEHKENERGRHYTERAYGRFERRIALDQEVDADKIDAHFNNGVLKVKLPKNPRAQDKGRHIDIKS